MSLTTLRQPSHERQSLTPAIGAIGAMVILFVVNLTGYVDRQILTLLVQPIKAALGLSDGEIGLMQGAAFVVTFAIASLFVGRLVDRGNRRILLQICVLIWSIGAFAGGFAQSGWQLFCARMLVGAGEAALVPCAISLISDYFPPERRGRAIGLFSTGIYAGVGLSLMVVGFAMPLVEQLSRLLAAQAIDMAPWRVVLASLIVPGVACCALLGLLREPARTGSLALVRGDLWSGFKDWLQHAGIFVPHHLGWAMANICQYAIGGWLPTILIREHGFDARSAGLSYGLVMTVMGTAGAYAGGILADRRRRHAGVVGRLALARPLTAAALGGFVLIAFGASAATTLAGAALVAMGMGGMMVIGLLSLSDLSPACSRGQISSIYLTAITTIAAAGGPAAVGYGNDLLGGNGHALSLILGVIGIISAGAAILLIGLTMRRVRALALE